MSSLVTPADCTVENWDQAHMDFEKFKRAVSRLFDVHGHEDDQGYLVLKKPAEGDLVDAFIVAAVSGR